MDEKWEVVSRKKIKCDFHAHMASEQEYTVWDIVEGDQVVFTCYDEEIAKRIAALWNAFNGISTHDALNIIQVAKSLKDEPGDLKYLEHGYEVKALLESIRRYSDLASKHTNKEAERIILKEFAYVDKWARALLAKLEGGE